MRPTSSVLFDIARRALEHTLASLPPLSESQALQLAHQSARHGLSAFVANALDEAAVTLPPAAAAQLASEARSTIANAAKHRRALHAVLDALAAADVVPVVLKGYGLASRIYAEPLTRPSSDVDVWVPSDVLPVVRRALATIGLREQHDPAHDDVLQEHHHVSFVGPHGLVEVHFELQSGLGLAVSDARALLTRLRDAELDGRRVRYLAPEDELVYLAVHAANHAFLRAAWLVDLHRYLAAHPRLDWRLAAHRAVVAGMAPSFATALALLETHLGGVVPVDVWQWLGHSSWKRSVARRLFSPGRLAAAELAEGRLTSFLIRLWLVDNPRRGMRHIASGARRLTNRALGAR